MTSDGLKIIHSSGYVISGFLAVISSFIVIFTISTHKSLHVKDFYILAGLSISDLIRGYGYVHGGITRIWIVVRPTQPALITPTDCMMQIYQTFMLFGQKASPLVVMMLSMDRFFAVAFCHRYKRLGTLYALGVVGLAYVASGIVTLFAWITALFYMPAGLRVPEICKSSSVTPNFFVCIESSFSFFPGVVSAFLYIAALLIARSKANGVIVQENDHKRQAQLTKNVAIVVLAEFLFTTLPFGYMLISFVLQKGQSDLYEKMSPFFVALSLFSATANLFLYALKYPKFRKALLKKRGGVAPLRINGLLRPNFVAASTSHERPRIS